MKTLQTIEPLNPETIVLTNERPLIAHCNDFKDYYIKYHKGIGSATRLFNEYLIACLLPIWGFNCPNYALVNVLPNHLPDNLGLNKKYFDTPCFGVEKIENCFDLTESNVEILKKSENKKRLKDDIIRLGFFDIFIANEDRHLANLNTLSKLEGSEYLLFPIDHVAIFNQHGFKHELTELTYDESIINSALFSKIVNDRDLPRKLALRRMKESLYLCSQICSNSLNEILKDIPLEWQINTTEIKQKLLDLCFSGEWFEKCWEVFVQYLQQYHMQKNNQNAS